jgi:2-polyprenyl-3-methyl-5-hydroxy-6-metoxy-1,4-benzoquinol methylase
MAPGQPARRDFIVEPSTVHPAGPAPGFPAALRAAWRASDPASRCLRRCDSLDRDSVQQLLPTHAGDYWLCGETGLLTREKFEMEIGDFYDEWWSKPMTDAERNRKLLKHTEALRPFDRYRRTGRLFEVGSGTGLLLKAAADMGWRVEGNELSPKAAAAARDMIGAAVHPGPMESVRMEQGEFDVIICDNVFEHLWKPREVLCHMAGALRPGGVIYLHTLNAQSFSLRKSPGLWHYFRPTHTHIPTLVSLRHCFDAAGLRPLLERTHGYRAGRPEGKAHSHWDSFIDKVISNAAGVMKRGHRVEYLLQKPM